ncbi:MAG TPA: SOS response-associated peptidase [Thermoanaerobaculia bacterium]
MCGRYTLTSKGDEVALLFDLTEIPTLPLRYNLAPTQEAAVVRVLSPGEPRTLDLLRWGLVPYWADDLSIGNRMINARSESVAEKPSYRWSFRKARCLIPADGFYEWKKEGKLKQPFHIRRKDRRPFAFAGLWARWKPPEGEPLDTFTILTTDANDLVKPLHNRMPVILDPKDFDLWLDPGVGDAERLKPLMAPAPGEDWETVPVSRTVNSPAYDGPACIEPLVQDEGAA